MMFASTTYLLITLLPLIPHFVLAHDPAHQLGALLALPISDECRATSECTSILTSNCNDDTCACSFTIQAQSCTRCMWTSESVDKYNDYLSACAAVGKAAPSPTQAIGEPEPTTSAQGMFTDIGGALGVDTQAVASGSEALDLEQPSTSAQVVSASVSSSVAVPTAPAATTSIYRCTGGGQTQVQAGASGLPAPLNGASGDATTGINVINDTKSTQTPAAVGAGTTALNSSRNFFSQAISQACVRHCTTWKTQADSCSDDRCLCASNTIYSAGVCNDCVGDSGRGGRIGTCYSEFKNACESELVGTTGSEIPTAVGQGALTDQLLPGGTAAAAQNGGSQSNLPYGYGADAGAGARTGQVKPMLVTDVQGVTYSVSGTGLSTQIVTATAQAMIAAETVVVDSGALGMPRGPAVLMSVLCLAVGLLV